MSTALNNAVKRKTHKERAQPSGRKKLGLLEKRKDYRERAQDYHKKEQTIKRLRHKAEERNPDEFYFAMQNARTKGGVHVVERTKANKFSQEELRLMKTQDAAYLSLKAQTEAKKMERLKTTLHLIGTPAQNKHTLFVDDEEEAAALDPAQHFDTPEELLDRTFNRPRSAQLQAPLLVAGPGSAARGRGAGAGPSGMIAKQARRRDAQYRELMQRAERQEKLASLSAKMSFDKQLMGKGRKRKLTTPAAEHSGGPDAKVFKWKQERKR